METKLNKSCNISKRKYTRWCFVPFCQNTMFKNPDKLFVNVPRSEKLRKQWFIASNRKLTASKSSYYCCEDHFDLPKDMENFMEYRIMGSVKQIRMKPGCLPSKFECQPNRTKRTSDTSIPQSTIDKQQKISLILEENETDTTLNDKSRGTVNDSPCQFLMSFDQSTNNMSVAFESNLEDEITVLKQFKKNIQKIEMNQECFQTNLIEDKPETEIQKIEEPYYREEDSYDKQEFNECDIEKDLSFVKKDLIEVSYEPLLYSKEVAIQKIEETYLKEDSYE